MFLQILLEHGGSDPEFTRSVLAGLHAYQNAIRHPRATPMNQVAAAGRARVLDYGGSGRPVLFVPSLINPPYVLDLAEENSLLRWLAQTGEVRPMLVDWGDTRDDEAALSITDHVEQILLPIITDLGPDIALAGYCLGGTMAIAAAARTQVSGLALIAAPWNFSGYPDEMRTALGEIWENGRPLAEALDLFPMEMLQSAFWRLDPNRTLSKFAAFGKMEPGSPQADAFVALEDWANEGPPLPLPAAKELIEDFFGADLPGSGKWSVGSSPVDPGALDCPVLNIISTSDRIVPATSAAALGETLTLQEGHVGMVIGRRAEAALWRPLAAWLSQLR